MKKALLKLINAFLTVITLGLVKFETWTQKKYKNRSKHDFLYWFWKLLNHLINALTLGLPKLETKITSLINKK